MKQKKKKDRTIRAIWFPVELDLKVKAQAAKEGRTFIAHVQHLCRESVNSCPTK